MFAWAFHFFGTPIPLPNGPARNVCERQQWYELAPARINALVDTGAATYHQLHEGAGVFEVASDDPVPLEDLWPQMQEKTLMEKHQARIDPIDSRMRTLAYWGLGGLAIGGVGIGAGVAIRDESEEVSTGLIVAGVTAGVIGLFAPMFLAPPPEERLAANARRLLFKPREDDFSAVLRGINRANGLRRQQCGGTHTPFNDESQTSQVTPTNTEPQTMNSTAPASHSDAK